MIERQGNEITHMSLFFYFQKSSEMKCYEEIKTKANVR